MSQWDGRNFCYSEYCGLHSNKTCYIEHYKDEEEEIYKQKIHVYHKILKRKRMKKKFI
jgi:hypothetical protein